MNLSWVITSKLCPKQNPEQTLYPGLQLLTQTTKGFQNNNPSHLVMYTKQVQLVAHQQVKARQTQIKKKGKRPAWSCDVKVHSLSLFRVELLYSSFSCITDFTNVYRKETPSSKIFCLILLPCSQLCFPSGNSPGCSIYSIQHRRWKSVTTKRLYEETLHSIAGMRCLLED